MVLTPGQAGDAPTYAAVMGPVPEACPVEAVVADKAFDSDAIRADLKARGIGSSVYYPLPLHLQPCFAYLGYREGQCPESERASHEVLSLPIYPELTHAQLDEVIGAVRAFYGR